MWGAPHGACRTPDCPMPAWSAGAPCTPLGPASSHAGCLLTVAFRHHAQLSELHAEQEGPSCPLLLAARGLTPEALSGPGPDGVASPVALRHALYARMARALEEGELQLTGAAGPGWRGEAGGVSCEGLDATLPGTRRGLSAHGVRWLEADTRTPMWEVQRGGRGRGLWLFPCTLSPLPLLGRCQDDAGPRSGRVFRAHAHGAAPQAERAGGPGARLCRAARRR